MIVGQLEIKLNLKTPSPHPSLLPGLTFTPFSLPPPYPPSGAGGRGMGVMVSSSHVVSAALSSSGGGLLTLFLCSNMRSLSQETVLHKLLQRESFPQAAALHELPQGGSFPRGAVLQEQAAPAWVPHGVTSPASKPALVWASLSTGGACSSVGSPQGHNFLQASTCSGMGSLPWATGGDLLHHGLQGNSLPTMVFSMSCKGKLTAPVSRAPLLPRFTDLGVCRVVPFTSSHSSLSPLLSHSGAPHHL